MLAASKQCLDMGILVAAAVSCSEALLILRYYTGVQGKGHASSSHIVTQALVQAIAAVGFVDLRCSSCLLLMRTEKLSPSLTPESP